MKRRDALKSMGAIAGATAIPNLLGGCDAEEPGVISHVVVLMMENRSYDHVLGARALQGFPGLGISPDLQNPDRMGEMVRVYHDSTHCMPDPPHNWSQSHFQFNAGKNDGFLRAYYDRHGDNVPPYAMGYLLREDMPFSWALADEYASCDAWFSSVLGPTWPNRFFLLSGQSNGQKDNKPGTFAWPTVMNQLDDAGVSWGYYYHDLPFAALFSSINWDNRQNNFQRFLIDAEHGTLPEVSFIDPAFQSNDDHPPHHPMLGQQLISSIYHALANSPHWNNSLMVVTYDENGGFFDQVPPPKTQDDRADMGFDQLGFRVPALVAGPYVKKGHVSSTVRDHTSVIAHLSKMFDLPPLTKRVETAADLSDLLDEERLRAGKPRAPANLPAIEVDESALLESCFGGDPIGLDRALYEGAFCSSWDRRKFQRDDVYLIAEYLDRLGKGRIRRK